jgi:hypothetical protein
MKKLIIWIKKVLGIVGTEVIKASSFIENAVKFETLNLEKSFMAEGSKIEKLIIDEEAHIKRVVSIVEDTVKNYIAIGTTDLQVIQDIVSRTLYGANKNVIISNNLMKKLLVEIEKAVNKIFVESKIIESFVVKEAR